MLDLKTEFKSQSSKCAIVSYNNKSLEFHCSIVSVDEQRSVSLISVYSANNSFYNSAEFTEFLNELRYKFDMYSKKILSWMLETSLQINYYKFFVKFINDFLKPELIQFLQKENKE